MSLYDEIYSQPEILKHSYEQNLDSIKAIGQDFRQRQIQYA